MTLAERKKSLLRRYGGRVASAGPNTPGPKHGPAARARQGQGGRPKNQTATIRRLLSYLEQDRKKMAAAFFCVIVSTLANLAGSYLLRPIMNEFIAPPDGSPPHRFPKARTP